MDKFIFSCDGHVNEPKTLFADRLPEKFRSFGLKTERRGDYLYMVGGGKDLFSIRLGAGAAHLDQEEDESTRTGGSNIELRMRDMQLDGVDCEIVYPQIGIMIYQMDREVGLAHAMVYNDWVMETFKSYLDMFVPIAMLPAWDPEECLAEFKRVHALGFKAVMLPVVVGSNAPPYINPAWDIVWSYAEASELPINIHTGTGMPPVQFRGPGGAMMNYMAVGLKSLETVSYLISGGVTDRFPRLHFVVCEAGASWMPAIGERLDEVYQQHQMYVRPKLRSLPSVQLYNQFTSCFQFDKVPLQTLNVTGVRCLMWASDYPHLEGTFPYSRKVLDELFDGTNVTPEQRAAIVGGNAARLFKIPGPRAEAAASNADQFWTERPQVAAAE